jgi:SYP7 family syntaxin
MEQQNSELERVGENIKKLKIETKLIGENIEHIGRNIHRTVKDSTKIENKLKTTNSKLKELLNKFRSGDKICIDIILICVFLGLVAVLYNTIKNKITDSTDSSGQTPTKNFLIM